jgi:hypothetical protein
MTLEATSATTPETTPEATPETTGHCLCGRVRYRARGQPKFRCYCHCESCRRATGAPVTAYAGYLLENFRFEGEPPSRYASSPHVTRTFCGHCGTPLTFESAEWPGEIHLLVGSADNPAAGHLAPERHVFENERISWVRFGDGLPRKSALPPA